MAERELWLASVFSEAPENTEYKFDASKLFNGGKVDESALAGFIAGRLESCRTPAKAHDDVVGINRDGPVRFVEEVATGGLRFEGRSGLHLEAQEHFASCRASASVTGGRWYYEVDLITSGVMQLGWCSKRTPFTEEEGVGDSSNSYAFDGHRVLKWNGRKAFYGEPWACGDTIGCAIDTTAEQVGDISFFRNGAPLGVAFSRVTVHPLGPLFPGLSLTEHSRCLVNFGQRRMRFLPEGFQPLTPPPAPERVRACQWLLAALERAAGPGPGGEENAAAVARAVGPHLAPLLCDEFLVGFLADALLRCPDASVLSRLLALLAEALPAAADRATAASGALFEVALLARCATVAGPAKAVAVRAAGWALRLERLAPLSPAGWLAREWLALPRAELLFAVEGLLTRKAHHDGDLEQLLPEVWHPALALPTENASAERRLAARAAAEAQVEAVAARVLAAEEAQAEAAEELARAPGAPLLAFLGDLLRRNRDARRERLPPSASDPRLLAQCFFVALRLLWPHLEDPTSAAFQGFPGNKLVFGVGEELQLSRLGGLFSYLYNTKGAPGDEDTAPLRIALAGAEGLGAEAAAALLDCAGPRPPAPPDLDPQTLHGLLDATVALFSLGVDFTFGAQAELLRQQAQCCALAEVQRRGGPQGREAGQLLARFKATVEDSARRCAWARCVLSSPWKQRALLALTRWAASALLAAAERPRLLEFAAEAYLETVTGGAMALRRAEPPQDLFAEGAWRRASAPLVRLLSLHVADRRIVKPDTREALLAFFTQLAQHPTFVAAVGAQDEAPRRAALWALMGLTAGEETWVGAAGALVRLLGWREPPQPRLGFPPEEGRLSEEEAARAEAAGAAGALLVREALRGLEEEEPRGLADFCGALVGRLNATAHAFKEVLVSAAQRAQQEGRAGRAKALRRGAALFHATALLLRLLAAVAWVAPRVFQEADGGTLLERACEAAGFVLVLTSLGGAETALFRRAIALRPPQGPNPQRPMTEAALAGPALSCMAALQRAFASRGEELAAAGREDLAAIFARTVPWDDDAEARARLASLLAAAAAEEAGAPPASASPDAGALEREWGAAFTQRVAQAAGRRAAAEAEAGEPVPEELRDPISAEVMADPVRLPSGHAVDRSTAMRCIVADGLDPFSRAPLSADQLEPADDLRERIAAFIGKHGRGLGQKGELRLTLKW